MPPRSNTESGNAFGFDDRKTRRQQKQQYPQRLRRSRENENVQTSAAFAETTASSLTTASMVGDDAIHKSKTDYPSSPTWVSGYNLLRMQFFGIILPLGGLTWWKTHSISASFAAMCSLPLLAILQGSLAIAKYRLKYGNSPLPKAPCHGVVKATTTTSAPTSTTTIGMVATAAERNDTANLHNDSFPENPEFNANTPLRLLVIGDSLAVGVGQSKSCTPIMPETIARQLSLAMNGRPVLWTCHGAPGASAGWIVRELEKSVKLGHFQQQHDHYKYGSTTAMELPHLLTDDSSDDLEASFSSGSDESSSSDENLQDSSNTSSSSSSNQSPTDDEMKTWQERLRQEQIHFDSKVVGPFDIAVVLTGSNDLKSAFFPFLLNGEEAEFRRQAQLRGGSYGNELSRMLQVLNKRMRLRLQTFRQSVEAATEKVRERLGSSDSWNISTAKNDDTKTNGEMTNLMQEDALIDAVSCLGSSISSKSSSLFPMVVLPGMPSRALPIFHTWPLRWFSVPVVDIMDSHKRNLAKRHRGDVLFVDAPPIEDLFDFADQTGNYWTNGDDQRTVLNLKSVKHRQAQRIEAEMKDYYRKQEDAVWDPDKLPDSKRHFGLFSVDGIHPNDDGYEFWGRFICHAIVKEWKRKHSESGGCAASLRTHTESLIVPV